jgi:hypothetical protein
MVGHSKRSGSSARLLQAAALAAALLCGVPDQVLAAGTSDVAADALLSLSFGSAQGLDMSGFVSDDGQNPFTTFAYRDPDGIAGSLATAAGLAQLQAGPALAFSAVDHTRAEGAPGSPAEVAWGQTTLSGGFAITNSLATDVEATVSVTWSWSMGLSAAGSGVDLGLGQVQIVLSIDGVPFQAVTDALHQAPDEPSAADSGLFTASLLIPQQGSREVSLDIFALSLAQASAVPEPASACQFLAGFGVLVVPCGWRRRRRWTAPSGRRLPWPGR